MSTQLLAFALFNILLGITLIEILLVGGLCINDVVIGCSISFLCYGLKWSL